jgi:hypothetical protein
VEERFTIQGAGGYLKDQGFNATGAVMVISWGKQLTEQAYVYHHGEYVDGGKFLFDGRGI